MMAIYMKKIIKIIQEKDKDYYILKMVKYMKEILNIIGLMEKEYIII